MQRFSLRAWLLLVSVLFTVLVVGGIALTTYVIVSDGMQVVVADTSDRIAANALAIIEEAVIESQLRTDATGLTGSAAAAHSIRALTARLPQLLGGAGLSEAEFTLYDAESKVLWRSSPRTGGEHDSEPDREQARKTGVPVRTVAPQGSLFAGLFTEADLAQNVTHVPVALPGGGIGVLDVVYTPENEERIIDAIRLPMAVLALSAMLIMVVLMQTSMAWVLNLVDDLRKAADSIDAGRLDERLPADADNEIGELARSINRLIERLQRRAEAQSRFVADASHELATPVAGIRGYTTILRAWGAEDREVRDEAIDAIDRESRRMARLTSDLLNLLHADQGIRLKSGKLDINVIARERLATTASRYLDKDIEFVGPEEESLTMVGDAERIEDVLSILLDNAGKYTPQGGRVSVQTKRRRELITVSVSDTGEGIAEKDLPHIFDRFFRSDKARAEGEGGFGLGLAIAKTIVENMGGTISAESTKGEGTTFTVTLPRGRL